MMEGTHQQQQYDPLSTPLVVRHRMSMPSSSPHQTLVNGQQQHHTEFVPNHHNQQQQRYNDNNNGGVVTLLPNGHANTVRWSCQSYESGITESSFNSHNGDNGSRVNVQEMLDRGFEETEVLRRWLDSFSLLCYFDSFLLAGYDSLSLMSRMTAEDLTAIGITEPNHRRRLRHELGKLHFADNYAEIVNDNLFEFLTQIGLEHYTGALSRTGCDTTAKLLQLELDDLEDVGVAKLGHQKRLYLAIKHYNSSKSRRTCSRISSTGSHKISSSFSNDPNATRPPISHHHHRNSAPVLRHQTSSSSAALIVGKTRPTSITKQLSTFQEAPRSPNVIVTNQTSSAAVAANFVQNGGLMLTDNNNSMKPQNSNSPYGFIMGNDHSTTAAVMHEQEFGIYSTGSINNNNRHSFNYSPLRFSLKTSSATPTLTSAAADSPTSRVSAHSGPQFSYQQQQQQHAMGQPSPTHSLNRLNLTHAASSFQQQRAHSIYSTPPPPANVQQQYSENYAPMNVAGQLSPANGHHATLPRAGGGGRQSALSFSGSTHSGNNNKKSPTQNYNGRVCDTIGEPLTGENDPNDFHHHSNNYNNNLMPYCRAASFENHLNQQQPSLNSVHQRRMSGHHAQPSAGGSSAAAPPPPPPRAWQTTLDYSNNSIAAEFPPPPSPLAVAPLPMMLSLQQHNAMCSIAAEDNRNAAVLPPATLIMPRKQPNQIAPVQSLYGNNSDISRDFTASRHMQPAYAPRTATLPELLALNSRVPSTTANNINKNFNISPDLPPNGSIVGGSISTTDSGNSSASSVDEEHDARTRSTAVGLPIMPSTTSHFIPAAAAVTANLQQPKSAEREPEDVLNEISGMLANLTSELDNMLQY